MQNRVNKIILFFTSTKQSFHEDDLFTKVTKFLSRMLYSSFRNDFKSIKAQLADGPILCFKQSPNIIGALLSTKSMLVKGLE